MSFYVFLIVCGELIKMTGVRKSGTTDPTVDIFFQNPVEPFHLQEDLLKINYKFYSLHQPPSNNRPISDAITSVISPTLILNISLNNCGSVLINMARYTSNSCFIRKYKKMRSFVKTSRLELC